MLWRGRRQSTNVEDRRGMSGRTVAVGGGLGGILLILLALLFGADPRQILEQMPSDQSGSGTETSRPTNPQEDQLKQFSSVVLAETEDVWSELFKQMGRQ